MQKKDKTVANTQQNIASAIGTVLLQFVNITTECVGITIEAQAQKVYHELGIP